MFTDASGNRELGWALTGPLANEDGDLVIWVCDDHEWDVSEREFRDPKGVAVASASVVILRSLGMGAPSPAGWRDARDANDMRAL